MTDKSEYLKSYIGKKCKIDITTFYSPFSGTIIKCENSWVTFETRKTIELINIDRINKISISK